MKPSKKLKTKSGVIHLPIIIALLAILAIPLIFFSSKKSSSTLETFAQTPTNALFGIDLVNNLNTLPNLRSNVYSYQVSSHDKTGKAMDFGHKEDDGLESYLNIENGNYVLLDEKGAGAINRIWIGPTDPGDTRENIRIQFYFDGEKAPRIDLTIKELFSGTKAPFVHPLVSGMAESSGGHISYVPIPFSKSLKITTSDYILPLYYNIGYEKYDQSVEIKSFTGQEQISGLLSKLQNLGVDPKPTTNNQLVTGTVSIPSGSEATIFQKNGAGVINALKLNIPQIVEGPPEATSSPITREQQESRDILMTTKILGFWDGEQNPRVDTPIGGFFGSLEAERNYKSLMNGMDSKGFYYSYYPMPYASQGVIKIKNDSAVDINSLVYEIQYDPNGYTGLGVTAGYFNALSHQELPTTTNLDYKILETGGVGHIVNLNLLTITSTPNIPRGLERLHLEGDERVHIDGNNSPALYGTGTEDIFNGGIFFMAGEFNLPTHGHPFHYAPDVNGSIIDHTEAYRHFIFDPISFRSGIKYGLEHGDSWWTNTSNQLNADYYSTVFWYGLPNPDLKKTDELDVGNSQSEASHLYTSSSSSDIPTQSFFYEGDSDEVAVSDEGGESGTGTISFKMNVAADKTHILRRRFDQSVRNQSVQVRVDGILVGFWHNPGRNSALRWRESEIVIPSAYTQGKNQVTITIYPIAGSTWTAFHYWLYSIPSTSLYTPVDYDNDTFSNSVEQAIGTDPNSDCSKLSKTDAFPPDVNADGYVSVVVDIKTVSAAFGKNSTMPDWQTYKRYDMDGNNAINIFDIIIVAKFFGKAFCP